MKYRFQRNASEDLREAAVFYESQREGLGMEFVVEVGIGLAQVLDAPLRWPEVVPSVGKYRLDRFPYGIYYRTPTARTIDIIAVFDLHRRPESLLNRFG